MDQSATEAGTHSRRIQRFSIHGIENWCEEKVVKVLYINTDEKIICIAFKVERKEKSKVVRLIILVLQ